DALPQWSPGVLVCCLPQFIDMCSLSAFVFFIQYTATTEIYTLSLHDALPIWKTLLMASSVRLKPLNCSRLPCVYANNSAALTGQIGRAVQQECRDRSRMPSSA